MHRHDITRLLAEALLPLPGGGGRAEAELLLAAALGRDRGWLYAHNDHVPDAAQAGRYRQWLARRAAGEPIAHLVGHREFWSLRLEVSADTLVPRHETERLVELALERLPAGLATGVLELGTGSGAIALAIANERPMVQVSAVEREARALEVARRNAARLGLDRVRWLRGDWYSPVRGERFAMIVSNPPYLAEDDPHLDSELRFEPRQALVAGKDGLDDVREIVAGAPLHLNADGWLLVEHGLGQGGMVRGLLAGRGFAEVETWQDLEHRDRVSGGRWGG